MRNIKLLIEYDGTDFAGWQTQNSPQSTVHSPQKKTKRKKQRTIQETIEKALRKILREKVNLIASGRTDAGVHALGQAANFRTKSDLAAGNVQKALNANLPKDIVITKAEEVSLDFHSRFSAKSKIYRYSILNRPYPSPILRSKVCFYPRPLDIKLMCREAKCLLGRHDFKSFCGSGSRAKNTVRTIKRIDIKQSSYDLQLTTYDCITIDIEANGFLYNMARNIVGTFVEVARGKMPAGSTKKILSARDRNSAGPTMPACGLCLMRVKY